MILAVDTYYEDNLAKTVLASFEYWEDQEFTQIYFEELQIDENYVSGEFYKRELPCILSILKKVDIYSVEAIIIDGYVYLDNFKKFGLGGHLYEKINRKLPIIGVAKTNFLTNTLNKLELLRGKSKNPLYITSIGIEQIIAKQYISRMFGEYRIPKLLKELDKLTK